MRYPKPRHLIALGSIAALSLGLAGGTAAAARPHTVGPALLVLKLQDLPKTFGLVQGKYESAAQASSGNGMSAAQFRTDGYQTGYINEFEKKGLSSATNASQVKGLVLALSGVFQFKAGAGAHTAYTQLLHAIPKQSSLKGFKMMAFGNVGTESQGYAYHSSTNGIPITFDFLLFRNGRYVSIVGGGGVSMTLGKQDSAVSGLATTVNHRIATSG
jgi:hypothetical protein